MRLALSDTLTMLRTALAGRYTIERELGRGGMSAVYLARDLKHDRPVALKVLLPELAATLGAERFQREIRLAARLQHPHILTVLDSGTAERRNGGTELLWFTMPYVAGESLRDRLRRERQLPVEEALRIAREAAQALQYAHEAGVVHRDIKPENLLLTRDGSTLVADFGIARAVDGDENLTRTGASMGTPAYMSPEQANAEEVDARTDVYSLAAVLFEMLAGRPPYTAKTAMGMVTKWLTEPVPSVRALRPEVPETVDHAIGRALARTPADRIATTAELVRALRVSPETTGPIATPTAGRRWLPALLVLALLALGAAGFLARRGIAPAPPVAPKVLAVLPFDNLGDSADAYFADGVANELRAKLSQLHGVEVIARGSSNQYRNTTKAPQEIARELGADYLLTATVQWDRASGGPSRVRVSPELVEVTAAHAPRAAWQQPFAAELTDVFVVQADIAAEVAGALGVVLGDSARRELRLKPTESLAAYDEFLKGEAAVQEMKADNAGLRRAIGFYERAVSLDTAFAQAWIQLSRARTQLYSNGVPDPALGEAARAAAERARALRPDEPLVYLAAGELYSNVNPIDNGLALAEFEHGLSLSPDDPDLLGVAAIAEAVLGRWDSVVPRLERAWLRDPRSFTAARRLTTTRILLRQYDAADSAADRTIALGPTNPHAVFLKVLTALGRGDSAAARAVIRAASARIDEATLLPYFAAYQDLFWVLDDEQQHRVLALPPGAFDGDRGVWAIVRAQLYHLRGDSARAAAYADSARTVLREQSRAAPDDAQRHAVLGVALAYMGRKAEAIREGRRGVELLPLDRDAYLAPYVQLQLVRILALTGEPGPALDALEPLLRVPFYVSAGWLRLDPAFDPLRKEPRFQRLAAGK
ncbi:MAG TPA: serine/threonine-protein kinase [Gemmatimonadales bacterium]|nr:serine/threonine-protein kinase [Gemmatimonadales bacterium]